MVQAAGKFVRDIKAGVAPYWLSILGPAGTGKTYLARRIWKWYRGSSLFRASINPETEQIVYPGEFCYWPTLANHLQGNSGYAALVDIQSAKVAILDEIGAERDPSGHVADKLASTLCSRMDEWTVITSNLPLASVEERLDSRVASRLVRGSNVCIQLPGNTPDFAFRG